MAGDRLPTGAVLIRDIQEFLAELGRLKRDNSSVLFFRGHADYSYALQPSIYRNHGWIANEDVLFKELMLRCPADFDSRESTFQMLVKMQHYSLPTRLLDLTANPLVALHFACARDSRGMYNDATGEIVVLSVPKAEIKYFDSDTVSVIANVSRRPSTFRVPSGGSSRHFNSHPEIQLLLHEIRREKPYFESKIDPAHLKSVICVKPKYDNARIIRQDGAFFLFGVSDNKLKRAAVPSKYLAPARKRRLLVRGYAKPRIEEQLESLGITHSSLFPEIESVASYIKHAYLDMS